MICSVVKAKTKAYFRYLFATVLSPWFVGLLSNLQWETKEVRDSIKSHLLLGDKETDIVLDRNKKVNNWYKGFHSMTSLLKIPF